MNEMCISFHSTEDVHLCISPSILYSVSRLLENFEKSFPYVSDVGGEPSKRYIQHCLHIISCTRGYEREAGIVVSAERVRERMRSRLNNIWPECVYINFCRINLHSKTICSYNVVSCSFQLLLANVATLFRCSCMHAVFRFHYEGFVRARCFPGCTLEDDLHHSYRI